MKEIKLKGLDESIFYDECDNGLKVYMWVKKNVNTFYGTLSVKYGSIYNEFTVSKKRYKVPKGVAHFLEHIKFNESAGKTAHDFFNAHACDTNAFTTFNYTNYQVFGSENAKDNVIHLLDFVQKDYFTDEIVEKEKGIIVEEANMGADDSGTSTLFKQLENIFLTSEYKYLITGTPSDIKKISLNDIKVVYDNFYHPENMFLVVTGNFNPYELITAIKENQNKKEFPKYKNPVRVIKKEPKKVNKKYEETKMNVTNKKIKIGIKIPKSSLSEFDELHIRLYLQILLKANFGSTSDFKDYLLTNEIISNASYSFDIFDDYVIIMFTIDSEYQKEIIKLFTEKLAKLEIDKNTFIRMKKANIASLILEYDDVEVVNTLIQTEILNYGIIIDNVKSIFENIKYGDILKFKNILNIKGQSILVINPLDNKKE